MSVLKNFFVGSKVSAGVMVYYSHPGEGRIGSFFLQNENEDEKHF